MSTTSLWSSHFGFSRTPFSKSVPADKLFGRAAHQEAVARIQYCIAESALGVVTGEVGAGKSVAVRAAVNGLDRTSYTVVYMANPSGGCRGLYVSITTASGPHPGSTRPRPSHRWPISWPPNSQSATARSSS